MAAILTAYRAVKLLKPDCRRFFTSKTDTKVGLDVDAGDLGGGRLDLERKTEDTSITETIVDSVVKNIGLPYLQKEFGVKEGLLKEKDLMTATILQQKMEESFVYHVMVPGAKPGEVEVKIANKVALVATKAVDTLDKRRYYAVIDVMGCGEKVEEKVVDGVLKLVFTP